jgi:elongation factor 3
MLHARSEVSGAAADAMLASCLTVGNRDLEPHIPAIVGCIAKAELVTEVIGKLSATTFVQTIEDGALGVMVPLLTRALRERSTTVKRRATIIIENMCKLVGGDSCCAVLWGMARCVGGLKSGAFAAAEQRKAC